MECCLLNATQDVLSRHTAGVNDSCPPQHHHSILPESKMHVMQARSCCWMLSMILLYHHVPLLAPASQATSFSKFWYACTSRWNASVAPVTCTQHHGMSPNDASS